MTIVTSWPIILFTIKHGEDLHLDNSKKIRVNIIIAMIIKTKQKA